MIKINILVEKGKIEKCNYKWIKPTKKERKIVNKTLSEFRKDVEQSFLTHDT